MIEWVEVPDPADLHEQALPEPEPAPEPEPLILPTKQKKCVVCQRGMYVTATEFAGPTVVQVYHQQAVLGAPCVQHFGWPQAQALGPHLCKTCLTCGYAWPEALPNADEEG